MARKTLEAWIKEAICDPDKGAPCTSLSLVFLIGVSEEEVHTTKLGVGRDWTPKDLAQLFRGKAETHCQDMIGLQTFKLLAFYGDDLEAQSRFRFVVSGQQEDHHGVTEPPTREGRMAQDMRITEGVVKLSLSSMQTIIGQYQSMLQTVVDHNHQLQTEQRDVIELAKRLIIEKAQLENEQGLKVEEFKRASKEREKWLGLLPPLVNTVTGKEIFPQSTADSAIIDTIATNATEEQLTRLAEVLPPEVMGLVANRMKRALEAKREEHEAALARTNEVEADAEEKSNAAE